MLDLKYVLGNFDEVAAKLGRRGGNLDLEPVRRLGEERRNLLQEIEGLRQKQNAANDQMKVLAKQGPDALAGARAEMKELSGSIKTLDEKLKGIEAELGNAMLYLPNIPADSVPDGKSEDDNVVVRTWGEKPALDFEPKVHDEIGTALGIFDFERAGKIAGTRFAVLLGPGARLERALAAFMLDTHTAKGYREVLPPYLVNRDSMTATGQLPKFEDDAFKTREGEEKDEKFLIPTAEVPLTNLHRDEIIEEPLPVRYTAWTPCFRREAGSYGRDTKGLIRQHQFHKVELVKFAAPENSHEELESLTRDAEDILQKLGLHYRVIELCTGDIGFGAAKTYDIEVWLPGQNAYREISSCSNFEDFQARRAQIRFRPGKGEKVRLVHTLNGSGLAIGRTVVAILEQYQRADGSVAIPEVLQPYMGGATELR